MQTNWIFEIIIFKLNIFTLVLPTYVNTSTNVIFNIASKQTMAVAIPAVCHLEKVILNVDIFLNENYYFYIFSAEKKFYSC